MEDKICTICKKGLTLDKFGKCKNAKDGLKPQCKECRNEENKQHYIKNKAKVIERTKKYSIDNKDKMRIWRIQYLKDNSAKVIERDTKYRRNHLERYALKSQKRRALEQSLPATLTLEQWETIKGDFDNKCAYCGQQLKLTYEHFIPLSKGGEYTQNNIIPVCLSCNSSKRSHEFSSWYPKQRFYNLKREKFILKYLNYKNGHQQLKII